MVLLDNMDLDVVREAVQLVAAAAERGGGPVAVEVSGGITLKSVGDYADIDGVDFISVCALTSSAHVLDIGLDLDEGR